MTWTPVVRSETSGNVTILHVTGRLGHTASGDLLEAIVGAIEGGTVRLLVDLEGVDYASSAGLLMLDAAAGRMHLAGGVLVLCALSEPVKLVLSLSGLQPHFAVAGSVGTGCNGSPPRGLRADRPQHRSAGPQRRPAGRS